MEQNADAQEQQPVTETPANPEPKQEVKEEGVAIIGFDDFLKVDLRVGTIVEAEPHPNADRLFRLQVDLGTEKRQICAGIREYYQTEDLQDRQVIVVTNLKPRKIRGEISNGMLLCASHEDGETRQVILLAPSAPIKAGSQVG